MGRTAVWSHLQHGEENRMETSRWQQHLHGEKLNGVVLYLVCSVGLHTCMLHNLFQAVVRCSRCQCKFVKLITRWGCKWCPHTFCNSHTSSNFGG